MYPKRKKTDTAAIADIIEFIVTFSLTITFKIMKTSRLLEKYMINTIK